MAQTKIKLIADGVIDANNLKAGHTITTDNIGEGTNLYYTDARVGSYLSTNSYATEGYVTTSVANLVDAAPSTLDTLNELAAALGDDPNFATTVTNSIATKLPLTGGTISGNLTVGTNTLFVDSANNRVSIGGGVGGDVFTIFSSGYPLVRFTDGSTTRGLLGYVFDWGYFGLQSESNLVFRTGTSGGAERMRIDSSGNVGIGTSSPSNTTHIYKNATMGSPASFTSANAGLRVQDSTNSMYFDGNAIIADGTGDFTFGTTKSSPLILHTNATERMRIDPSGNVGIGTSSPETKLHINGTDTIVLITEDSEGKATLRFGDTQGSVSQSMALAYNTGGGDFTFTANGSSERMRITSGGDVLFGTTGIPNGTSVYGTAFESTSSGRMELNFGTSSAGFLYHIRFWNPNGGVGSISTEGSSTSFNTSSDYRLKENVVPMEGALDRVDALNPSRFNFISDPEKTVDGFLAHEVAEVIPEAISGEKDAVDEEGNPIYQGIDQSKLVPLLTAAIQELNAKIQELENKLTANGIN